MQTFKSGSMYLSSWTSITFFVPKTFKILSSSFFEMYIHYLGLFCCAIVHYSWLLLALPHFNICIHIISNMILVKLLICFLFTISLYYSKQRQNTLIFTYDIRSPRTLSHESYCSNKTSEYLCNGNRKDLPMPAVPKEKQAQGHFDEISETFQK